MVKTEMRYLNWLIDMVDDHEGYRTMLSVLFGIDYYWQIERDANRAADAFSLRRLYFGSEAEGYGVMGDRARVLEVLVALARRIESDIMGEGENDYGRWFWEMIANLGLLGGCEDDMFFKKQERINTILYIESVIREWLDRKFRPDGYGSPFPIPGSTYDQRDRELWYQMNDYLVEHYDI